MILKNRSLALIFTLLTFPLFSQENLINNGSFESLEGKLKALGCIENATGWFSPTGARADIFTPSKTPDINVPENIYGKEDAKDGSNYAGIVAFSFGDALPRTYIFSKLTTPLKKGQKYCVKFSLSLSEASKFASNQIGINFSSKPYGTDSKTAIIEKTHILDAKNKIFNAMYNWEEVCGVYIAEGGEKFLNIGNFTSNENTKSEKNKKDPKMKTAQISAAYYYIDDVSVIMLSEDTKCNCVNSSQNDETVYSTIIYQKAINVNDKMSANEKIELQVTYFGFGKAKLTPTASQSLDLIVSLLKENPDFKLEIIGHNDEMEEKIGKENPSVADIANKRNLEIIEYLTAKGISESRLVPSSLGSSEANSEISESDEEELKLAKNRRVSFKVR